MKGLMSVLLMTSPRKPLNKKVRSKSYLALFMPSSSRLAALYSRLDLSSMGNGAKVRYPWKLPRPTAVEEEEEEGSVLLKKKG